MSISGKGDLLGTSTFSTKNHFWLKMGSSRIWLEFFSGQNSDQSVINPISYVCDRFMTLNAEYLIELVKRVIKSTRCYSKNHFVVSFECSLGYTHALHQFASHWSQFINSFVAPFFIKPVRYFCFFPFQLWYWRSLKLYRFCQCKMRWFPDPEAPGKLNKWENNMRAHFKRKGIEVHARYY